MTRPDPIEQVALICLEEAYRVFEEGRSLNLEERLRRARELVECAKTLVFAIERQEVRT